MVGQHLALSLFLHFGLIAETQGFENIRAAEIRSDGLYNVVCMDYSVVIGVTYEEIVGDQVC